MGGLARKKQ